MAHCRCWPLRAPARPLPPSVQLAYDLGEMARLALRLTTAEARQLAEALFAAADYGDG